MRFVSCELTKRLKMLNKCFSFIRFLFNIFFHSCFFGLFVTSLYSSIDRHTHKQILRSISKTVWGAYLQHHLFWASILQVPFHWKCCYLPKHFAIVDVPTPNANTLAVCSDEQEFICLCINFPLGKYPTKPNQTKPEKANRNVMYILYFVNVHWTRVWLK